MGATELFADYPLHIENERIWQVCGAVKQYLVDGMGDP